MASPACSPQEKIKLTGEAKMMMSLLDLNDNGQLEANELEGDAKEMLEELDSNNDGTITAKELSVVSERQVDVHSKLAAIDTHKNQQRIVDLPNGIHRGINRHFKKYTNVLAPNGKPIHCLAMDGWSEERILRARKVLEHFLTDVPDRQWGNKTALANAMANNHATMVFLNTNRDMDRVMPALENLNLQIQDLRANESPYEGEDDYMKHQTRDAAYEEVFHLIHASGVLDAMKDYDREIRKLAKQATKSDLWNYDEPNMPGNHFEYIICVYDNYLDLWKTKPTLMEGERVGRQRDGQSFHGEYKADQRANTRTADPEGFAMIEKFNPNSITYSAELPTEFKGTFSIAADGGHRYSEKAKHLLNVTLRGEHASNLVGNSHNNRLVGNASDNVLSGNGGDDSLFGGPGNDTAVFRGKRSQYTISRIGDLIEVRDSMVNRDGYDVLSDIETLKFENDSIDSNLLSSVEKDADQTNSSKTSGKKGGKSPYAIIRNIPGAKILATKDVDRAYVDIAEKIYNHMTSRKEPINIRELHKKSDFKIILISNKERFSDLPEYQGQGRMIDRAAGLGGQIGEFYIGVRVGSPHALIHELGHGIYHSGIQFDETGGTANEEAWYEERVKAIYGTHLEAAQKKFGEDLIHEVLLARDNTFSSRLAAAWKNAQVKKLWKGTYAGSEPNEYWAEGVAMWFRAYSDLPATADGDSRDYLQKKDPRLYELCESIFPNDDWKPNDAVDVAGKKVPFRDSAEQDRMEGIETIIHELDQNEDGKLQRSEIPREDREQFDDMDSNGDGIVTTKVWTATTKIATKVTTKNKPLPRRRAKRSSARAILKRALMPTQNEVGANVKFPKSIQQQIEATRP